MENAAYIAKEIATEPLINGTWNKISAVWLNPERILSYASNLVLTHGSKRNATAADNCTNTTTQIACETPNESVHVLTALPYVRT